MRVAGKVTILILAGMLEMNQGFMLQSSTNIRHSFSSAFQPTLSSSMSSKIKMQMQMLINESLHLDGPVSLISLSSATGDLGTPYDLSLQNTNVVVFIAGLIPFLWATIEFWRRIAIGEPFGTSQDSVLIAPPQTTKISQKDDSSRSRGRRTLGRGALVVAYILFTIAAGVIGLTFYSVLTSSSNGLDPSLSLPSSETMPPSL